MTKVGNYTCHRNMPLDLKLRIYASCNVLFGQPYPVYPDVKFDIGYSDQRFLDQDQFIVWEIHITK